MSYKVPGGRRRVEKDKIFELLWEEKNLNFWIYFGYKAKAKEIVKFSYIKSRLQMPFILTT